MDLEKDKNDFWNIEKLIPPKKNKQIPPAKTVVVPEFGDGFEKREKTDNRDCQLTAEKRFASTESYVPNYNVLLSEVSISKFANPFDFYDSFRRSALLFYDVKGGVSPFVPFYSYMPQYTQLTPEQRAYYFYFRDEIRHGVYPKTDYSYIYLYIYEILNLPDKIPPTEGIIRLCRLWAAYRKELPVIDKYMTVWVQDYCLLYKLTPPLEEMRDFLYSVAEKSSFREFYLSLSDMKEKEGFSFVLRSFSDYDWRTGKYAVGGNKDAYEKYYRLALTPVLRDIIGNGAENCTKKSVITRDAFPYSLCTQRVKARLAITYCPLSSDVKIRESVTSAVKYTENCIRAALGVRSRLSVHNLEERYKRAIDAFFADILAEAKRKNEEKNKPEYEKKYDPISKGFSFSGADEIEEKSWATTLRLVDEDTRKEMIRESIPESEPTQEEQKKDGLYGLSDEDIVWLQKCLSSPQKSDVMTDAAAERVNCAFSENFGDVILENTENAWTVMEDYREDVEKWLIQFRG